jgi:hypothetical protein
MPFLNVTNNAESTLASGISASATSLTVATGGGALFPSSNFHVTIDDEILECTSRIGDVFTVQRGQEGTTPAGHGAGAKVQLRWTAAYVTEIQTAISDAQGAISALQAVNAGPFLLVGQNTSQQVQGEAWTKVQFQQVVIDTHNAWDSNNHRFVCPVAGYYVIIGRSSVQNIPDGKRIALSIFINNDENLGGRIYDSVVGGQTNVAGSGAVFQYLSQGDYVELKLYHSNGSALNTVGYLKTDALCVVRIA